MKVYMYDYPFPSQIRYSALSSKQRDFTTIIQPSGTVDVLDVYDLFLQTEGILLGRLGIHEYEVGIGPMRRVERIEKTRLRSSMQAS